MQRVLNIRVDAKWTPQDEIFEGVLERVTEVLAEEDEPLARALLEEKAETERGTANLHALDVDRFCVLYRSVEHSYMGAVMDGMHSWNGPGSYPLFMNNYSLFKALLHTDPRIEETEPLWSPGVLALSEESSWRAEGWIYDIVLENMAAHVQSADRALAIQLISARSSGGNPYYNGSSLDLEEIRLLAPVVDFLYTRYGDGKGRDAHAPAFFAELAPSILRLHSLFRHPRFSA